jgi:hypothetical protein
MSKALILILKSSLPSMKNRIFVQKYICWSHTLYYYYKKQKEKEILYPKISNKKWRVLGMDYILSMFIVFTMFFFRFIVLYLWAFFILRFSLFFLLHFLFHFFFLFFHLFLFSSLLHLFIFKKLFSVTTVINNQFISCRILRTMQAGIQMLSWIPAWYQDSHHAIT